MKTLIKLAILVLPLAVHAEVTTGWLSATGKTTKYFNDPENWANGDVNGVFSSELSVTGEHTISLTNNWTGSLKIYAALGGKINLNSAWIKNVSAGNYTLTLDDDLWLTPSSMSQDFTFGNSYYASNCLNLDFGGTTRTIHLSGAKWIFSNRATNGDVVFDGTGTFTLRSAAGFDGNVTLCPGLLLATGFTSSDKTDIETTRAANLTMNRSQLNVHGANVNVTNVFAGGLKVMGKEQPGCSIVSSRATTEGKSTTTTFHSLSIDPGALLLFRGAKLGNDPTGDSANVYFAKEPTLVGGLIPGALAAKTDSDAAGLNASYDQTFVTYTADRGVVPLDLATDYVTALTEDTPATVNLMVPHATTVTIDQDTTVNSLYLATEATSDNYATVSAADGAKLTVSSGIVLYGYPSTKDKNKYPLISAPLDFGTTPGYIICAAGKRSQLDGPIHGSSGVTFTTPIATTAAMATSGLVLGTGVGESTYTGNTYVQSFVSMGSSNFLPHDDRSGDVYVNGTLNGDNFAINGLYGCGLIGPASSSGKTLTVGGNNANGDFAGTISLTYGGGKLSKIGTGTQRFSGQLNLQSTIDVNGGKVILDGTVEQGAVNVAAGAALGGSGVVKTSVAFAEGAKLLAKVEGKTLAAPLTVADVSGTAIVEADGSWKGEARVLKAADGATLKDATFVKGANVGALRLSDDKTELYASPKTKGIAIVIM